MQTLVALALMAAGPALAEPHGGDEDSPQGTPAAWPGDEANRDASALPALTSPAGKPLTPADLPPPNVFAARAWSRSAVSITGRERGAGRGAFRAIIAREASSAGLPPELVDAVMAAESGYNPSAVGADGEIGLMQIMPATARMLGFVGSAEELGLPEINIHFGAKYLAGAWRLAGQDICTTAMKYRAGHGETRFSFRSVDYCKRIRAHLAAAGFPVTGSVPPPSFGPQFGASHRGRPLSRIGASTVDLHALNARLRKLTDKIVVHAVR